MAAKLIKNRAVKYIYLTVLLVIVFTNFTLLHAYTQTGAVGSSSRQLRANQQTLIAPTPASSAVRKALEMQLLLPEGFKINGRVAKLIKLPMGTAWYLAFEEALEADLTSVKNLDKLISQNSLTAPQSEMVGNQIVSPFAAPMEVLPGYWLNTMLKEVGDEVDMSVDFHVTGEVTTYHNRNYILPTFVAQPPIFGQDFAEKMKTRPAGSLDTVLRAKAKTAQETSAAEKADKTVLPGHLSQILLALQEARFRSEPDEFAPSRILPGISGSERAQAESEVGAEEAVWKDGHVIVDRVGRFQYVPESDRWSFHFEADGQSLAEPPVMLHPCQLLEAIEKISRQTTRSEKFRVTGQISLYLSRNYMLVRMVHKVYDSGNIGKGGEK